MSIAKKVFVALDNMNEDQIFELLPKLSGKVGGVKIGLELYLQFGRALILKVKERFDGDIFLDLKLHDIPNTVSKAVHGLSGLPIRFLTLHASGGEAMISQALLAAKKSLPKTTLLAVTILTSLDDQETQAVYQSGRKESFLRLLSLIERNDQLGLVCSGAELSLINNKKLITMVPGIRFEHEIQSGKVQDQKSVFTPSQAISLGAHFLVMGRSLTESLNLEQSLKDLDS